jgi:hypothetical protein
MCAHSFLVVSCLTIDVVSEDRPRLLHARSELGYTDQLHSALPGEPEAVSVECQRRLSVRAVQRRCLYDRETWLESRTRIVVELELLGAHRFDREVASYLRVMRRTVERVDRLLDA